MKRIVRRASPLLALACAVSSFGAEKAWQKGPSGPPTTAEGRFAGSDVAAADKNRRSGAFESICDRVDLHGVINLTDTLGDFTGTFVRPKRALVMDENGELFRIDEARIQATAKLPLSFEGIDLDLSPSINGRTMVSRPLHTRGCGEVAKLLKLTQYDPFMSLSGEGISKMAVGELWAVPMTLTYSGEARVGSDIGKEMIRKTAEDLLTSITFGAKGHGEANMTLYRVDEKRVRLQFLVDHVRATSYGGQITQLFPGVVVPTDASNFALRLLEKFAQGKLKDYISASLGYVHSSSHGAGFIMEFVVDPTDPVQAEAMAKAMKGNFVEVLRMAKRQTTLQADDATALKDYEAMLDKNEELLGSATYGATNAHKAPDSHSIPLRLPLLYSFDQSGSFGEENRVTVLAGGSGEIFLSRSELNRSNTYVKFPLIGGYFKGTSGRRVESVTTAPEGGEAGKPFFVYTRTRGYVRSELSSVRGDIKDDNKYLSRAGALTANPVPLPLPVDEIAPAGKSGDRRSGLTSLAVVFSQDAVDQLAAAQPKQVLQALQTQANPLGYKSVQKVYDWLIENGKFSDGLSYDAKAATKAFPATGGSGKTQTLLFKAESERAANVISDLAAVRNAKDNEERAVALTRMLDGTGKSRLAFEHAMGVYIQLIDPNEITGDFVANLSGGSYHGVLEGEEVPGLEDAAQAKIHLMVPRPQTRDAGFVAPPQKTR